MPIANDRPCDIENLLDFQLWLEMHWFCWLWLYLRYCDYVFIVKCHSCLLWLKDVHMCNTYKLQPICGEHILFKKERETVELCIITFNSPIKTFYN